MTQAFSQGPPTGGRYCWVGLVVEVEPGHFFKVTLRSEGVLMEQTREECVDFFEGYPQRSTQHRLRFEVEGYVSEYVPTERPEWATSDEIEPERRAIGAR